MSTTITPEAQGTKEAAKEQKAAQVLNDKIVNAIKKAESSLEAVAVLLAEAKETNIHTLLGFQNWQSYVEAVVSQSEAKLMGAVLRNQLLKMLLDAGVSVRSAARAVGTSPATASRINNGSTTGERGPGAPKGVPQKKRTPAIRLADEVKAYEETSEVRSSLDDLKALRAQLLRAVSAVDKKIAAVEKVQADEAAKAERQANANQGTTRTGVVTNQVAA